MPNTPLPDEPELFLRLAIEEARVMAKLALDYAVKTNAYETTLRHLAVAVVALEDAYEERPARPDYESAGRQRLADGVPF